MEEDIKKLADELFTAATTHSVLILGDGITDDDEAFSKTASPEEKIRRVTAYLVETV
jgi:hypothetical protein